MADVPKKVTSLLDKMTNDLPAVLSDELAGIYLYGSLTQNAFNPKRSDIDCVIVTKHELTDDQFDTLAEWFAETGSANKWTARLQASILIRDEVLLMGSPGCLYQFGKLTRSGSDGNPIFWLNILESGVTLYGEPPVNFVPEITSDIVFEALQREVGYIRDEFLSPDSEWRDKPKYRAYAVLTLCRILYTNEKAKIVSKPKAAIWAFRRLPTKFHPIIRQAIPAETDHAIGEIPLGLIASLIDYANKQLKNRVG